MTSAVMMDYLICHEMKYSQRKSKTCDTRDNTKEVIEEVGVFATRRRISDTLRDFSQKRLPTKIRTQRAHRASYRLSRRTIEETLLRD